MGCAQGFTNAANGTAASNGAEMSGSSKSSANTYAEAMKELNQRFSTWLKDQIRDNPASVLIDAVNVRMVSALLWLVNIGRSI